MLIVQYLLPYYIYLMLYFLAVIYVVIAFVTMTVDIQTIHDIYNI